MTGGSSGYIVNSKAMAHQVDGVGLETRARASHNAERFAFRKEYAKISYVLGVRHGFCSLVCVLVLSKHHNHRLFASYRRDMRVPAQAHIGENDYGSNFSVCMLLC